MPLVQFCQESARVGGQSPCGKALFEHQCSRAATCVVNETESNNERSRRKNEEKARANDETKETVN